MGILSELDSLLEKIPLWKRLKTVPDDVDRLKQQVAELEAYIKSSGGEKCPRCSQMSYSLDRTVDDPDFIGLGVQRDYYKCSSCGYETFKQR